MSSRADRSVAAPHRTALPAVWALVALLALAVLPKAATAQEKLATACQQAGGSTLRCTEAATTARAVQGHLGLMSGLGSEVPGSAGTLGRRLGTTPRVAVSGRVGFTDVGVPDPSDAGEGPAREAGFILPSLQGQVALGLFDGFSPMPTVGGVLSVDLLGGAGVVFFPKGQGFDGSVTQLSFGARVGLLRESFTLPGVAVSLTRRLPGPVTLGALTAGDRASVTVDPGVTSVRATVGKDLLSVGVLAGLGYDRYDGDAILRLPDVPEVRDDSFTASRTLFFGGASLNFLILQLSSELGWATGFSALDAYRNVPYDVTGGTLYGSLAFRLTL